MDRNRCSVCNLELECPPESIGHSVLFECRRCGRHLFSSKLSDWLLRDPLSSEQVALASYELHRRSREGPDLPGEMTKDVFNRILTENSLPTPPEQLNLLFLHIGNQVRGIGKTFCVDPDTVLSVVGAESQLELGILLGVLRKEGLITDAKMEGERLTIKGWKRLEELRRGKSRSKIAFMAMDYHQPELDDIVDKVFRPAVAETGFRLKIFRDEPSAGLMDVRMRVEIRAARFLIADLSHHNNGAY